MRFGVVPDAMQSWLKNDDLLSFKSGLSHDELMSLWRVVKADLIMDFEQHHCKRQLPLSPFATLLFTLYWLRHYPPYASLAAEFMISASSVEREIERTIAVLCVWVP